MQVTAATQAGSEDAPNEDKYIAGPHLIAVLDGLTARMDTGCRHGVSWFTSHLAAQIFGQSLDLATPLSLVLRRSIELVADMHPECDLTHPSTPAAALALFRLAGDQTEYLVLGDVPLVCDYSGERLQIVSDQRINSTAFNERKIADQYPIGSPEKESELLVMKYAETALRNHPGGYWVAAATPEAAAHALIGTHSATNLKGVALLSDGAARLVDPFRLTTWPKLLDQLSKSGPDSVLTELRAAEVADPLGDRWPRNKRSDDATIVYLKRTGP